jgi:hypothetical protein
MPLYGLIMLVLNYVINLNDESVLYLYRKRFSFLMMETNNESCMIDSTSTTTTTNSLFREKIFLGTLEKDQEYYYNYKQ